MNLVYQSKGKIGRVFWTTAMNEDELGLPGVQTTSYGDGPEDPKRWMTLPNAKKIAKERGCKLIEY